jgi:hypothetical protein
VQVHAGQTRNICLCSGAGTDVAVGAQDCGGDAELAKGLGYFGMGFSVQMGQARAFERFKRQQDWRVSDRVIKQTPI